MPPQLPTETETAVEQLITLLINQRRTLEAHQLQIEQLTDRNQTLTLGPFLERASKVEDAALKLRKRVDELEKLHKRLDELERIDSAFDDDLKAIQNTLAHMEKTLKRADGLMAAHRADLLLFWRMTFLGRLAWLLGGARLFKRAAALLMWWRQPWRH